MTIHSSIVASVHMWGFYDDDHERPVDGAAPSDLSVYHHHQQVARNLQYFGSDVHNLRTTRTLDGLLVATEFDAPAHGNAARMWHRVVRPSDVWPDPTRKKADQ